MAGIGFLLKKLLREDRYVSDIKANLYSMVVSSGPWLFAILCIAGLSIFSSPVLSGKDLYIFRVFVIYVYAFSLIVTSVFQLVLTRFISDRIYQRDYSSLLPNFVGAMFLSGIVCFSVSSLFMAFTGLDFFKKAIFVIFFCAVSFQWIIMVFLSSMRDYARTTSNFFIGYLLSFVAAIGLGSYLGINGYLIGFTLGQSVVVILLTERIIREFPFGKDNIFEFTRYFRKYQYLAWSAFLYTLGLWIDKIIVLYSPLGRTIEGSFRIHFPYDTASFLAILTIIPAMSIFFLQSETDFYEGLLRYIDVIIKKGTYKDIEHQRARLSELLKEKVLYIIKIQSLVTLLVFLFSYSIIRYLGFEPGIVGPIFMIMIIGSFFQALFIILIVLFWYLELLTESVLCISTFAILNAVLNIILVNFTGAILGTGYLISTVISFVLALVILMIKLKDLNYIVFMNRPMSEGQIEMPKFD